MPPKKKKKNTRTDAALDAMRLYGFPDDLIRTHLKQLLKVYGQDHWFFIEENAYKVLLDSILEQVEQDAIPQPAYKELHQQGDIGAGPSREVPALPHSETETSDIALQTREGLETASQFNGGCDTASPTCKPDGGGGYLSLQQGDIGAGPSREVPALPHSVTETSDIALQTRGGLVTASQFNGDCDTASPTCKPDGGGGYLSPAGEVTDSNQINLDLNYFEKHFTAAIKTSAVDQIRNANFSPKHAIHSPQGVKIRRRRHHGWIDSDEEEDEVGLVELEPMPLAPELASLLSEAKSGRQGGI
ncbi:hypothetical protein Dsin_000526 [Dipteronia sinensis]|uniref:WIYLD domain-containing protein n=1 Tax=Dipteronia sinensis TaxID=43782 RepID=A0AAE0B3I7_9ROSI|nr:hypothetical protein Dsin_000526 [Dipteronia sinensis]